MTFSNLDINTVPVQMQVVGDLKYTFVVMLFSDGNVTVSSFVLEPKSMQLVLLRQDVKVATLSALEVHDVQKVKMQVKFIVGYHLAIVFGYDTIHLITLDYKLNQVLPEQILCPQLGCSQGNNLNSISFSLQFDNVDLYCQKQNQLEVISNQQFHLWMQPTEESGGETIKNEKKVGVAFVIILVIIIVLLVIAQICKMFFRKSNSSKNRKPQYESAPVQHEYALSNTETNSQKTSNQKNEFEQFNYQEKNPSCNSFVMDVDDISKDKSRKVKATVSHPNIKANQGRRKYSSRDSDKELDLDLGNGLQIDIDTELGLDRNQGLGNQIKKQESNEEFQLFPNNFQMPSELQMGESNLINDDKNGDQPPQDKNIKF